MPNIRLCWASQARRQPTMFYPFEIISLSGKIRYNVKMINLNTALIHPSWSDIFQSALLSVETDYLHILKENTHWLPGPDLIFSAFSQPLDNINYILFGESPYPRADSANGYAFWDAAVHELWSDKGLTTAVNRATSLRNLIKMLLVASGDLDVKDTSQMAIATINKQHLVGTIAELFSNFIKRGFLLLNASLVLQHKKVRYDALKWRPFIEHVLAQLHHVNPNIKLILFGKVAEQIRQLPSSQHYQQFVAEHPYNISFISNSTVLDFFRPLELLLH